MQTGKTKKEIAESQAVVINVTATFTTTDLLSAISFLVLPVCISLN